MNHRNRLCYGCAVEEDAVPTISSLRQELEEINRELRKTFHRLESLLEKQKRALREAEILEDHREREHLEEVIRQIERKLREIRQIGLVRVPPEPK